MSFFSSTKTAFKNEDIDISREDYGSGPSYFCFYLMTDLGESDHCSPLKSGNECLSINFADKLAGTINVIAFAEFQNVLKKERYR